MPKEGLKLKALTFLSSLGFFVYSYVTANTLTAWLALFFWGITLFIMYFFRDPEREVPPGEKLILSPSDGKIVAIEKVPKLDFLGSSGTKISTFLSVWDVHFIRSPIDGKISYYKYSSGKFKPAFKTQASLENEQAELGIENHFGKVVVKKIAGVLARRIVTYLKPQEEAAAGAKLGMIRFGSRVELILPEKVELKVQIGQKLKAGETVVGVFK